MNATMVSRSASNIPAISLSATISCASSSRLSATSLYPSFSSGAVNGEIERGEA